MASRFLEEVWHAIRMIPPGFVATYGDLAAAIGRPGAARVVARGCANNPHPYSSRAARAVNDSQLTPCHRVIMATGKLGGYSGQGGVTMKVRLLAREGVRVSHGRVMAFASVRFRFVYGRASRTP